MSGIGCAGGGRGGSAYVAVLSATGLLVLTGLAGVAALRVQRATVLSNGDTVRARELARSGVELALEAMRNDDDWRSSMAGAAWLDEVRVDGSSTISAAVTDPGDGELDDSALDAARVVGVGHVNAARQTLAIDVNPEERGHRSLGSSMHAGGLIEFRGDEMSASDGFSSNLEIASESESITSGSDSWAMDGGSLVVSVTGDAPPDVELALKDLMPLATEISYGDLDAGGIRGVLLSTDSNPYGEVNALGLYYIDADGREFVVENSVIEATLVVQGADLGSGAFGVVNWSPADENYPAMVVTGEWEFGLDDMDIEGGKIAVGPKFEGVLESEYESGLSGLFAVAGDVAIGTWLDLEGVLVTQGEITIDMAEVSVRGGRDFVGDPVVGFVGWYEMVPDAATWVRLISQ